MNEWLKKVLERIKNLWTKSTTVQKLIFFGIIGVVLMALVLLVAFNSAPSTVPLFNTAITDETLLDQIQLRLDEEGVDAKLSPDGKIYVKDRLTADRMKNILFREDLIPENLPIWDFLNVDQFAVTDFERNIKLRNAIIQELEYHIEMIDGIDNANVILNMPEDKLFVEDQNPVTASVVLTPRPGSEILTNRGTIEGIQDMIRFSVEGLNDDNIVILDQNGNLLNDFANMADFDDLELARRQMKQKFELENKYRQDILTSLIPIFTKERIAITKVEVDLDFRKERTESQEFYPVTLVQDNPLTPFDETQVVESITRSQETTSERYSGTGINPEGPPGQEGQTSPSYKDYEGLVGTWEKSSQITNNEVNMRNIYEEKSPWIIKSISVGIALDGVYKWVYDDKGRVTKNPDGSIIREYVPVSTENLDYATDLVESAIGYDKARGDTVTVRHIPFDHRDEQRVEDEKFRNRQRLQEGLLYSVIAVLVLAIAFIVFRLINREIERRRRLREEELSRQHQAMREAALRSAEEEGVDVQMSVEERARLEMQENAINMAREHPEDVAQLIRTWLIEE